MIQVRRILGCRGSLLPLSIVSATALLLAGIMCSVGVRIALLYVQTSQLADSQAVQAASLSSAGLNGCAAVLDHIQSSGGSCSDSGSEVHVVLSKSLSLPWADVEVFGQARIGYVKWGSGG